MKRDFVLLPVGHDQVAIIDWEDAFVAQFSWRLRRCRTNVYVERTDGASLHRTIIEPPPGFIVDHIDGDGLNNRRSNLRVVSQSQNLRNIGGPQRNSSSGALGVSWHKQSRKWVARIYVNGKNVNIGRFDFIEDATVARLKAEKEQWGVQPRRAAVMRALASDDAS